MSEKIDHSWMTFKEAESLLILNDINRVSEAMANWTPEILGQMHRAVHQACKNHNDPDYTDAILKIESKIF